MDTRTCFQLTRALADGDAAFLDAVERAGSFDARAFAAWVDANRLREWFSPLARWPSTRVLLPPDVLNDLLAEGRRQPAHKQALVELSHAVGAALQTAGIAHLFMKGLFVAQRFYGDVTRRHQFDVDVLVRRDDFEGALEALASIGFDTGTERVTRRVEEIRERDPRRAPQTVTVRNADNLQVDLHWATKSRWFHGIDEEVWWAGARTHSLGGVDLPTLSDEHTLQLLAVSVCADLKRGACRGKALLDLYLVLREIGHDLDWERDFEQRAAERLLAVHVNVFALLLSLWDCADEFPLLARALETRARHLHLRDADDALALVERPRHSRANAAFYRRLGTRTRLHAWSSRLTLDLPHTVARALRPRRGRPLPWSNAAPVLPAALANLLGWQGLSVSSARPITTRPGRGSARQTFRLVLSDGRLLKGRVTHRAGIGERMQRWLPLLPEDRFSRLLATDDTASLETWVLGTPAPAGDRATITTAGGMLGAVHDRLEREPVDAQDERFTDWLARLDGWVDELASARRLDDVERVRARLRDTRPARATWGLTHGDFCLENLVVGANGLCCVDNSTVKPGPLEADLGQTLYRWPMSDDEREDFLEHYERHADTALYREHAAFWHMAAALRSAAWRSREGCAGLEVPLAELARHVA
ncbi:MAG: nucleotidyltransferase family protein [Planctomycetota bacterium]